MCLMNADNLSKLFSELRDTLHCVESKAGVEMTPITPLVLRLDAQPVDTLIDLCQRIHNTAAAL